MCFTNSHGSSADHWPGLREDCHLFIAAVPRVATGRKIGALSHYEPGTSSSNASTGGVPFFVGSLFLLYGSTSLPHSREKPVLVSRYGVTLSRNTHWCSSCSSTFKISMRKLKRFKEKVPTDAIELSLNHAKQNKQHDRFYVLAWNYHVNTWACQVAVILITFCRVAATRFRTLVSKKKKFSVYFVHTAPPLVVLCQWQGSGR